MRSIWRRKTSLSVLFDEVVFGLERSLLVITSSFAGLWTIDRGLSDSLVSNVYCRIPQEGTYLRIGNTWCLLYALE